MSFEELERLRGNDTPATKPYVHPEPGTYKVRITGARYDYVGKQGLLKLCWKLETIEGGDLVLFNSSVSEAAVGFLKGNLEILGVPSTVDIADTPKYLPTLIGKVAEIRVKQNGEYTNIDFTRLLSEGTADPAATEPEPEPPIEDDDIPFG